MCRLTSGNKIKVEDRLLELWWVRLEQDFETEKKLIKEIIAIMCDRFEAANQSIVSALNSDLNRYVN